jgi:hypothetical protein
MEGQVGTMKVLKDQILFYADGNKKKFDILEANIEELGKRLHTEIDYMSRIKEAN